MENVMEEKQDDTMANASEYERIEKLKSDYMNNLKRISELESAIQQFGTALGSADDIAFSIALEDLTVKAENDAFTWEGYDSVPP